MSWVTERLGAEAIVFPGIVIKDHARAAIQQLSGRIPQRTVFSHTGWKHINGGSVYLHGAGAVGRNGVVPGIEVRLPDPLSSYQLPNLDGGDLKRAVGASLRLLGVARLAVTVPVLGAVFRSVLGRANFSVHLSGPTGTGKSELAALALQHFGSSMDAQNLPTDWSGTPNALEGVAFSIKDAVLVLDDFAPHGSIGDVQRFHRDADRLIRAQGNNSGRLRMRSDASLRSPKRPRGLMLSTGEDIPHGQSLRSRMFVVELSPGDVDWGGLGERQSDAMTGLYALTMAGFIQWTAQRYDKLQVYRRRKVLKLREAFARAGGHRRTPEIVANLWVGVFLFLVYAKTVGALTLNETKRLARKSLKILRRAVDAQAKYHAANDPARRFLELIWAAISSGRAYVADSKGGEPANPVAWGWRKRGGPHGAWEGQGNLVGWLSKDDLYLEPDAAYSMAQRMAKEIGESIAVSPQTMRKRLHEAGLLASVDGPRKTLTVRRKVGGAQRAVLHVKVGALGITPLKKPMPGEPDDLLDVDCLLGARD